jgi:cob(I)alamin adenosyltransferase
MARLMTQDQMRKLLPRIGWQLFTLANKLKLSESSIRYWEVVPEPVANWLWELEAAHQRLPPPVVARRRRGPGRPRGGSLYS